MASSLKTAAIDRPATTTDSSAAACLNRGIYTVAAALVIADTIDMCILPARHIPIDLTVTMSDLDEGTALVWDAGIYDPDGDTDDDNCFIDSSSVGQTAGVARMDEVDAMSLAPVDYARYVRITIDTAPGTPVASGEIVAVLTSRPKDMDG